MKVLGPFVLLILIILGTTESSTFLPANAFKLTNCGVDPGPKGVAVHNSSSIWVSIEVGPSSGGPELEQFTGLPNNCNHPSPTTINGDPDFVNVTSSGVVAVTNHILPSNQITYYDPSHSPSAFDCTDNSIDEGDKIITFQSAQYFSSFSNGNIIKSVEGSSNSCTITHNKLPGTSPHPEGIAYSGQGSGLLVVDNNNEEMYLYYPSTGTFSQLFDFSKIPGLTDAHPWNIAVDYKHNIVWVTFLNSHEVISFDILSQHMVSMSPSTSPYTPYDIAISGDYDPVFTFNNSPIVGKYDTSFNYTNLNDDWTSACSPNCMGIGIDVDSRTGNYFATIQHSSFSSSSDQLTVGATACNPTPSGDWIVDRGCTLLANTQISGNVYVNSGVLLTVSSNTILNIGLNLHKLVVNSGGGILIQPGAQIV